MNYLKSFKETDMGRAALGSIEADILALRFDYDIYISKFNGIISSYLTCIEFDYNFIRALAEKLIEDKGNSYETEEKQCI